MTRRTRILIVDDDPRVRKVLREAFDGENFDVIEAPDAGSMLRTVGRMEIDVIALDIGLPGEDGLTAARRLRTVSDVPIVMITGKGDTVDKVLGLELGADDYICKPFHIREVIARVRAVVRRRDVAMRTAARALAPRETIAFNGWRVDLTRRELRRDDGEEQELTGAEFELLKLFVTNPNKVLSRDQIMDRLKGRAWSPYDRGIDMQVRRLRQKIEEDPSHPRCIKTIRGAGYLFAAAVETEGTSAERKATAEADAGSPF